MKKNRRFGQKQSDTGKARPGRGDREGPHPDHQASSLVYGVLPVLEALRANPRRIDRIVVAEGTREHRLRDLTDLAQQNRIRIERLGRENFDRLAGDVNHQGVVACTASADYVSADQILANAGNIPLLVLLDGVEDPRNFGAILRTAECAGAGGVFIPERRAVGLTETVAKSAAGATEYVKVAKVRNLNRLIDELKERNIWVVGASGEAAKAYTEWDWRLPTALVLGGEGRGLHRLVAEKCDILVKIPLYGKIESLNVSVAAGIILFEARRQRNSRLRIPGSEYVGD